MAEPPAPAAETAESAERAPAPLLIVISGQPATGKTTLARRLASDLGLPLLTKDDLKETLFETLGVVDRAWSKRLGAASMALLARVTATLLGVGQSLVIEANFIPEAAADYRALLERSHAQVAQVWMHAERAVVVARFEQRAGSAERHAGHNELASMAEMRAALLTQPVAPLALGGALFTVETSDFASVDYGALLAGLRAALRAAPAGATAPR